MWPHASSYARTNGDDGDEKSVIIRAGDRKYALFDVIIISNKRDSVSSGYPNTEKRVENTTHSRVFFYEI